MNPVNFFKELTPLGKADVEMKKNIEQDIDDKKLEKYEESFKRYRDLRTIQMFFQILLYASIITAVATTFGLDQLKVIEKIASYLGTTLTAIFYIISNYFTMVAKESYHVRREVLISENID